MRLTIVLAALVAMALQTLPASAANPLAEKTIGFGVFKTSYGARGLGNVLPLLVVYDGDGDCRAILTPESFGKLQGEIQRALGDSASACTFELVPEFAAVLRSRPTDRDVPVVHLIVLDHPLCIGCVRMKEEVANLLAEEPRTHLFTTTVSMNASNDQNRATNDADCPTCDTNAAD